jgi:type III pantothenate kinase
MNLLFDLGNTRLKCARADAPGAASALPHAGADFEPSLADWLDENATPGARAWLAAVAPEPIVQAVERALDERGIAVQRVHTRAAALGLRVAYAEPARLGVDRWLAMLGARARGDGAWLVAVVGSALTVDAITAEGEHLGGLIAPPPEAMHAALVARAPRLAGTAGEVQRFARSTPDAIASGCVLAAAALIERSYDELRTAQPAPRLLLSGGGAAALRPWLPPHLHAPALVLEGLAQWAAHGGG